MALVGLAFLGPAWVMFVSSALQLYLRNLEEIGQGASILVPYCVAASLVWVASLLACRYEGRGGRSLAWMYLLSGMAFLVWSALHSRLDSAVLDSVAAMGIASALVLSGIVLGSRVSIDVAISVLALAALGFVVADAFSFARDYRSPELADERGAADRGPASQAGHPNIYHVVFDEYQTDVFQLALDEETSRALAGFTFFPNHAGSFGRTGMALPGILTGREFDFATAQIDYQKEAFASEHSMLHLLKQMGYVTEAYLHPVYNFGLPLFDWVMYHEAKRPVDRESLRLTFFALWLYAYVPRIVAERVVGEELFAQLANQNVLNPSAPVISYHVMQDFIDREPNRASHGRYTFIHLILPHFPSVLYADCSYESGGGRTSPLEQARCANLLMRRLLATLERLGRLTESIVVFQADHGSGYAVRDGRLVSLADEGHYSELWSRARSRPLLLVKPPLSTRSTLAISLERSYLLDTAPTILGMLGRRLPRAHGVDLLGNGNLDDRERYYYFYDKKGPNDWTDSMMRYRVLHDRVELDGTVALQNNPAPK